MLQMHGRSLARRMSQKKTQPSLTIPINKAMQLGPQLKLRKKKKAEWMLMMKMEYIVMERLVTMG